MLCVCVCKFQQHTGFVLALSTRIEHIYSGSEKDWLCTQCSARYVKMYNIVKHVLQHAAHQPSACEECGERYKIANDLTQHMRASEIMSATNAMPASQGNRSQKDAFG
jgi:hypothetical protein